MPPRLDPNVEEKLRNRLRFYEDLGLAPFYRDRGSLVPRAFEAAPLPSAVPQDPGKEKALPRPATHAPVSTSATNVPLQPVPPLATGPSLFSGSERVAGDTLLKVREDLGDCTRCKLHRTRNKIVFGDGNPTAELVFVGEGPGADEDAQGLPFVGRAGKLLTQMIEAMGLQRRDVYICNVVKCRPPGNRQPEKDEVDACSPFLHRQLDVIQPKAIVCLGATAAQTLLQTTRSISGFRGQWQDYRGFRLLATYHPAYLLRNPAAKGDVWKDLQKVMGVLGLEVKRKGK
ncbi:MAG TPA: uracil-DNA glycosylase [Dongiaceae bacterium]|nr:uracil-DNA glycosylase [Dongiaceae bacterium]